MVSTVEVADVLGLGGRRIDSPLALAEALEKGLPVGVVDRICRLVAPDEPRVRDLLVARATLARRRQAKPARLSVDESERVERLARVWSFAMAVWRDQDAARRFLREPHPLLDSRRPIEVAARTDVGARAVEDILGRLKYGSAA